MQKNGPDWAQNDKYFYKQFKMKQL